MGAQAESGTWVDGAWRLVFRAGYQVARVWWFVRRPEQHGAYVVVWHGDELLMIRNSYKRGETVPCGGIDRGESPLEAARRELREEVGIEVAAEQLTATDRIDFTYEYKRDHAHFFEVRCDARPDVRIDRREVVSAEFVHRSQLLERPLVPALRLYLESRIRAR